MLEALCRQSSTTLDIVHAEDGPPITQRTSGLGISISKPFAPQQLKLHRLAEFANNNSAKTKWPLYRQGGSSRSSRSVASRRPPPPRAREIQRKWS